MRLTRQGIKEREDIPPIQELARQLFQALDGGFWGLMGAFALLTLIPCIQCPKESKLKAFSIYAGVIVILTVGAVFVAAWVGSGNTRPRSSASQFLMYAIWDSSLISPARAFAQETPGLESWTGWLYAGGYNASTGTFAADQAYLNIVVPSGIPLNLPQKGNRVILLRSADLYEEPPRFFPLQLRWALGARVTISSLPRKFPAEVTGNCAIIANRDVWCPVLLNPTLVPGTGLLPDFPLAGSWTDISMAFETRHKPTTLKAQKDSPNLVIVPQTGISLIFSKRLDRETDMSAATLVVIGVEKSPKLPVLGTDIVVAVSTRGNMLQAFKAPERQRVVETEAGRRLPCFAYPSRGISFVVDDKARDVIVEAWIFKPESYEKYSALAC